MKLYQVEVVDGLETKYTVKVWADNPLDARTKALEENKLDDVTIKAVKEK